MKGIKQKIFNHLDEYGHLTDSDVARIYGKEPNWITAMEYSRQWNRLQKDREYFKDKKIVTLIKPVKRQGLCYLENGYGYLIGKEYFNEIKKDFVPDNSRPDFKTEMYKRK